MQTQCFELQGFYMTIPLWVHQIFLDGATSLCWDYVTELEQCSGQS